MTSRRQVEPPGHPDRWLLLIYRVPSVPASRRTLVWRRLKGLGAVYLQQAAAVLPASADARSALAELARRITGFGGEASLLEASAPDEAWAETLVGRFNDERDREYAEIVSTTARFVAEIRAESAAARFTFAQFEEIVADWARIRRWHTRVAGRDSFAAPGGAPARAALASARQALDEYREEVYRRAGLEVTDLELPRGTGSG